MIKNYLQEKYTLCNEKHRMNIRVVNEYSWSNLFAYNMFLRPTEDELIILSMIGLF